jgi:hypothetical protein
VCSGMATEVGASKGRHLCCSSFVVGHSTCLQSVERLCIFPPPVPYPFVGIFTLDLSSLSLVWIHLRTRANLLCLLLLSVNCS